MVTENYDNSSENHLTKKYLDFYQTVDREKVYTAENIICNHPFYSILLGFIEKWGLYDKKCLEIGSSKGLFQDMVLDYTGVDVAHNLSNYYHKRYIVIADERLPFPDKFFDGIFTYTVHEHIPDLEAALSEIIRVLKPGGVCLFAPAWHTRSWFAQGYAVRPYSELSLREKLIKFSIPFRDFFLLRWSIVLLRRIIRLLLYAVSPRQIPLRYKKLEASFDKYWQSDSDACNSLDPFDLILWLRSRNIICHGNNNWLKIIFVRTTSLELQKPATL